ncbi:MAG: hypothetical protein FJY88_02370 [Candidatus Eisenbacteria bacterium]|nr:hypothetical protein [Candidatus Eisenbacteria bacterium]
MMRGRIALLPLVALLLLAPLAPAPALAQWCTGEAIQASSRADTIYVHHIQAPKNCCSILVIDLETEGFIANFYETEFEPFCTCTCCFNLRYYGAGFAPGHYIVRVWDGFGNLIGETEVDVLGSGTQPFAGGVDKGECLEPGVVDDPPGSERRLTSWGKLRTLYW